MRIFSLCRCIFGVYNMSIYFHKASQWRSYFGQIRFRAWTFHIKHAFTGLGFGGRFQGHLKDGHHGMWWFASQMIFKDHVLKTSLSACGAIWRWHKPEKWGLIKKKLGHSENPLRSKCLSCLGPSIILCSVVTVMRVVFICHVNS